jgi:hypothetical protein
LVFLLEETSAPKKENAVRVHLPTFRGVHKQRQQYQRREHPPPAGEPHLYLRADDETLAARSITMLLQIPFQLILFYFYFHIFLEGRNKHSHNPNRPPAHAADSRLKHPR